MSHAFTLSDCKNSQSISNTTGMGIREALDWIVWACSPPDDSGALIGGQGLCAVCLTHGTECWFCRDQDVSEEKDLHTCSKCLHLHCADCVTRDRPNGAILCKFCFYCARV